MKLAEALKKKNKLADKSKKLVTILQNNNSILKGNERSYDPIETLSEMENVAEELAALKARIQKTNAPIQYKIFKMSELKGLISSLMRMSCHAGAQSSGYGRNESLVEYEAVYNDRKRDELIESFQEKIEKLQGEVDYFNHTTDLLD